MMLITKIIIRGMMAEQSLVASEEEREQERKLHLIPPLLSIALLFKISQENNWSNLSKYNREMENEAKPKKEY